MLWSIQGKLLGLVSTTPVKTPGIRENLGVTTLKQCNQDTSTFPKSNTDRIVQEDILNKTKGGEAKQIELDSHD